MKTELSDEARSLFLKEIGLCLERAGFQTGPEKNGLLPVRWNDASLCRVNAAGGAQFRKEELDAEGASEAFHRALDVTMEAVEYLQLMQKAPQLKARGLDGDYRLLLDFNGTVLAGFPTKYGTEFVTWEWDFNHTGMWQGHYYGTNFAGAKKDFAVRARLIRQRELFEPEQLEELYRCCQRTRELDEDLSYQGEQQIIRLQDRIEAICPGVRERVMAMEPGQSSAEPQHEMNMD